MIYFTSDLHFEHNKDFIYEARGFIDIEEMNRIIINNYNNTIKNNDTVYILGDCVLNNIQNGIKLLKELNGNKILIIGNHDTKNKINEYIKNNIFYDIQLAATLKYSKIIFHLTHYPTICGNFDDSNIINLHGHTHQTTNFSQWPGCYHVGVDSHKNFPVSIEEIINDIKERKNETALLY